jgi:hypothetical protein
VGEKRERSGGAGAPVRRQSPTESQMTLRAPSIGNSFYFFEVSCTLRAPLLYCTIVQKLYLNLLYILYILVNV